MELSLEAYRNILKHVQSRADVAKLCLVSKGFRYVAERALYNTLYMHEIRTTMSLCATLAEQPRLALLVDALTISLEGEGEEQEEEEEEEEEMEEQLDVEDEEDEESRDLAVALALSLETGLEEQNPGEASTSRLEHASGTSPVVSLPPSYWNKINDALTKMRRLRHLNILINSSFDTRVAWILDGCTFRLRSFHSDLIWDEHLVAFLNLQNDLEDLYIIDYDEHESKTPQAQTTPSGSHQTLRPSIDNQNPIHDTPHNTQLRAHSIPNLSTLECTFSEAAVALVPGRPIDHLKTCFSRSDITEKRTEMHLLFSKIRRSTRRLKALDIADSSYSEEFSMELLRTVGATATTSAELRYFGTLVLPVGGQERLQFYGLLMRLHRLVCVELEVSEWDPSPVTAGLPAFRALANELRLYCPSVTRVVFVHEFERTIVAYVRGVPRLDVGTSLEDLWRDVC